MQAIEEWKHKSNTVVKDNTQTEKVTRRRSGRVARWCSQQPQSNLIATSTPSLQAFIDAILQQEVALTLLKNLGSNSRSARDRGREPANHSKAAAFGPSPGKLKPRKFTKMDVVVRYVDFLV
ncbi:hypothetical protein E2C01_014705 [Portunus trituberculatus]|uniref:Uncharacterized protein n=1 Tax=Portunus trituberculatus TaxID=210409 RepID=A0A5B7DJU2_PORTR|nr:hypothetical protein [Portunus trituberculatus]